MSNITVVLAADTGYAEQVHTLMKSICTHNTNVDFYLMHNTFRREWINYTNQKLAASGSRLNDVKIEMDFSQYRRLSHISDAAFFRLMMQHLPVDRALYLDSDMVVTQSLHDLFNLDIRGYPVAAVQDSVLARIEWKHPIDLHTTPYSNSGMLLADLVQWREHNIAAQLLKTAACLNEAVLYGDQCFLNTVFRNSWLELNESWNFQTGAVEYFQKRNLGEVFPNPTLFHPLSTTPHAPNRGCAITARFLLSKSIGNTIAPTGRTRNFRQGFSFPSIILKQPIIKNKRPSEIVSDGL